MKEFEYFVKTGAVKKQSVDMNLAKATRKESSERLLMAKSILQTQKAKYALENAYESIREDIDAILFSEGFKSFSHEATVAYLLKLGFSITDTTKVDRLRKLRNGIKYYGEDVDYKEALDALKIADSVLKKLKEKKIF